MNMDVSGSRPNLNNRIIDTLKDAVGSPHTLNIQHEQDNKGGRMDVATMFGSERRPRDTKRGLRRFNEKKISEIWMESPTGEAGAPLKAHKKKMESLEEKARTDKENPGEMIPLWKKGARAVRDACRRDTEKARRRVGREYAESPVQKTSEEHKGEALYNKRHYGHSVKAGVTFSAGGIGVAAYAGATIAASKGAAALHPMVKGMHIPTTGVEAALIQGKAATGGGVTGLRGVIKGVHGISDISKRYKAGKDVAAFRADDPRVARTERQMKSIITPLMSETKGDLASIELLRRNGFDTTIPQKLRDETTNVRWDRIVDNHLSHRNEQNNHNILIGLLGDKKGNGIVNLHVQRTRDLEALAGFDKYITHLHTVAASKDGGEYTADDRAKATERLASWERYPAAGKELVDQKVKEAQRLLAERVGKVADEAVTVSKKTDTARFGKKIWNNTQAAAVGSLQEITVPVGAVAGGLFLLGRGAARAANPMHWSPKAEIDRTETIDRKAQDAVKKSVGQLEESMSKAIKAETRGLGLRSNKLSKPRPVDLEKQGASRKIAVMSDRDVYVRGTVIGKHNAPERVGLSETELHQAADEGYAAFTSSPRRHELIREKLGISTDMAQAIGRDELMHMQSAYLRSQWKNNAPKQHIMDDAKLFGISDEKQVAAYTRGIKIDFHSEDVMRPKSQEPE